jgi:hypothetical protein
MEHNMNPETQDVADLSAERSDWRRIGHLAATWVSLAENVRIGEDRVARQTFSPIAWAAE